MVLGYLNHIVQAVGKLIGSWNSQDSTITDMCFFLVEETVNKSDFCKDLEKLVNRPL